jgi:hypothetical protein
MSKIIKFIAQDDHVWNVRPKPYPAAKGMPQWWKDIPAYIAGDTEFSLKPKPNVTVKRCVPTLDVLCSGYYVPLWADVLIQDLKDENNNIIKDKDNNTVPLATWNTETPVLDSWPDAQADNFKHSEGYSRYIFKNCHGWSIKTPPGWSSLFIHPVAYPDLPFKTISGIVDTDIFQGEINVPFVVKNGFTGLIKNGTPMFQVIPFKRENWTAEFEVKKPNEHWYSNEKLQANAVRAYHSLIKKNKTYR